MKKYRIIDSVEGGGLNDQSVPNWWYHALILSIFLRNLWLILPRRKLREIGS